MTVCINGPYDDYGIIQSVIKEDYTIPVEKGMIIINGPHKPQPPYSLYLIRGARILEPKQAHPTLSF